ncbi:HAD family hydrolase [Candidatus Microgenomates bacterium]|nr:MAG: HAD family hydrolase [Candidatus Microgenomates bacterium]
MEYTKASARDMQEIFVELESSEEGLSTSEAEKRLKHGKNLVPTGESSWLSILKRQFRSPFIYLLLAAGALAIVLGETLDGLLIFLFVLINTVLGFYQEFRSEKTAKLLKNYLVRETTIMRDGEFREIDIQDVVVGDVLSLEPGDIVPADARITMSEGLVVDESVLTGESVPLSKTDKVCDKKSQGSPDNIVFAGCHVVFGKAHALVISTGQKTSFGKIAALTLSSSRESGYEKEIGQFSRFILILVVVTIVAVFLANVFLKNDRDIVELLIFSVALAVSVIPEALPVVTTFSLSIGALKMAKNNVIVKRLSAIEDLGSIQVLCSDKTGTLTENVLTVDSVYPDRMSEQVMSFALVTSPEGKDIGRHVFDTALEKALGNKGKRDVTRLQDIPFDPDRRLSSVLIESNGSNKIVARGAAEVMLKLCKLTKPEKLRVEEWILKQESNGNRVLVVGEKHTDKNNFSTTDERGFSLVGAVSFTDPVKATVKEAIELAQKLNVEVKILTGDSAIVAGAISRKIGLIEDSAQVLTGDVFEKMSNPQQHDAVNKYAIFARVTPDQKYRIIELLRETKRVGFLGEGINDAPALKIADVGLVVKEASDIATEAADIILLKRSLKVIIEGVVEGRKVFTNTTKYITSTLASNFGNFFAVAAASLLVPFLPMLPIQILLLNLLSDFPMIAIATDNVDKQTTLVPRGYDMKDIIASAVVFGAVSTLFDFIFFGVFQPSGASTLYSAWFIGSTLTELLFIYSVRARVPFWKGARPSRALIALTALAGVFAVAIPISGVGQNVFKFGVLGSGKILLIFVIVAAYFIVTETVKLSYYKFIYSSRFSRKDMSLK